MVVYPYSSPIILNDDIFVMYGGQTGTMSSGQRQAAYLVAEKQATRYIGTFLLPTIITGTYPYDGRTSRIATDFGYVHEILSVKILGKGSLSECSLDETDACTFIFDDTFGYLDVQKACSCCNCNGIVFPYQFQIVYRAGLPSGTANQPDVLLALTIAAQITLNEMVYPSQNESLGDVGVESFSIAGQYSEKRVAWKRTAFGASAKAQKAAQLMDGAVTKARPTILIA